MNLEETGIKELSVEEASFSYNQNTIASLRKTCGKNGIVGQPRALSALSMGMSVNTKGYNIYISGEDGTGRHSAVRQIAQELPSPKELYDLIYVHNFDRNEAPFLLLLPSPYGGTLQKGLDAVASFVDAGQWG